MSPGSYELGGIDVSRIQDGPAVILGLVTARFTGSPTGPLKSGTKSAPASTTTYPAEVCYIEHVVPWTAGGETH